MIKSMTGFGRYEITTEERKVAVEIKAVNHRYCEISIRLPKKLNFYEAGIRNVLKGYINRGKVDVFVTYEDYTEGKALVKYNSELALEYFDKLTQMGEEFGIKNEINTSILARFPEVFTIEEQSLNEEALWNVVEETVKKAAECFVETRSTEGENLKRDLLSKLDGMILMVDFIEERMPQVVTEYRAKLKAKVAELLGDSQIDERILATELTMFADKICVDEETVRLRSHINAMKDTLLSGENVGRKLDFIAQEMNREANTILSKSSDLAVTNQAIDLKTEIEKVREQIQNIE